MLINEHDQQTQSELTLTNDELQCHDEAVVVVAASAAADGKSHTCLGGEKVLSQVSWTRFGLLDGVITQKSTTDAENVSVF